MRQPECALDVGKERWWAALEYDAAIEGEGGGGGGWTVARLLDIQLNSVVILMLKHRKSWVIFSLIPKSILLLQERW